MLPADFFLTVIHQNVRHMYFHKDIAGHRKERQTTCWPQSHAEFPGCCAQVWQLLAGFTCLYLGSFLFFSLMWYIVWK